MNRFQKLILCFYIFCGSFSHQGYAMRKNTPHQKTATPTTHEYIYEGVLEGPLFECPNVLTSLGESISNYVQCIASVIELQKQCLISLEKLNSQLKQQSSQSQSSEDKNMSSVFTNYILSSMDEITLTMLIDIPEIGEGEFDRRNIDKTISMASLVELVDTEISFSFPSLSSHQNNKTILPTTKKSGIMFKKGIPIPKGAPPVIRQTLFVNRLGWEEVAAQKHDNVIPMPWKLWNETAISTKYKTDDLDNIDEIAEMLYKLDASERKRYVFHFSKMFFSQESYYQALSIASIHDPIPDSTPYISSGLTECAYVFFRRPFVITRNGEVEVDLTCGAFFPGGQARCSQRVLLSDYAFLLATEFANHGNIKCAGVNINEWSTWKIASSPGRHTSIETVQASDPSNKIYPISKAHMNLVQASFSSGAQKAASLLRRSSSSSFIRRRSLVEEGEGAWLNTTIGSHSTIGSSGDRQEKSSVQFYFDLNRENGTYGNALQMRLANASPLLVTEAGTQWTDVIVAARVSEGRPSIVIHPSSCSEAPKKDLNTNTLLNKTSCEKVRPLFVKRFCYTKEKCDRCWFLRGFCIFEGTSALRGGWNHLRT